MKGNTTPQVLKYISSNLLISATSGKEVIEVFEEVDSGGLDCD
jgi:hypothetical protein